MNNKDNLGEKFTSDGISKYWTMLNFSNDISQKQAANAYFSNLKEKCPNYLEISIELFNKSNSNEDKLISSILIYQYIKEKYNKIIDDKNLFLEIKDFLINKALISYINSENNIFESSKDNLIIERICYSISLIVIIGCFSHWPESIDEMLSFGKQTIKHTYLITIIFGNCYDELINIYINKNKENIIKEKFVKNKEEFKSFINTILISSNNIDKKLYNKTIFLAKNLVFFEVNTLQIPNMIKIILENISISNIDSFSKLIIKCIEYSKSKKIEDQYYGLNLSEYDEKMNKDELLSLTLIIEYISLYIKNNTIYDKDILFGFGTILSEIIDNYVYLLFKKDILSQKLFYLFFFFISNKSRIISQLFFESLLVIKNFINACYNFSNYSQNEKIEFSNYLLNICQNILINCRYKKIEKQEILLKSENIIFQNNKENKDENDNINNEEDILNDIDEIPINEYRNNAEDAIYNIFLIFANNFLGEGINYFFESITKEIIPLLKLKIEEINNEQILIIESVIFGIKSIVNCFETLMADKTPLINFILFLTKSQIINNNFICSNFLLLIEEASSLFDYNEKLYSQIIIFLLNQIELRINSKEQSNLVQLTITVLLSICEFSDEIYVNDLWEKMFFVYNKYYDQYNDLSLYNFTESICSSLIIKEEEDNADDIQNDDDSEEEKSYNENKKEKKKELLPNDLIINKFIKIVEIPITRIKKINDIIINKNNSNIFGNKEKEELLKKEIIKNFSVISRILKQCSFIKDKIIINQIFNYIYSKCFKEITIIIKEYINNSEIINHILKIFAKSSPHLNIQIIDQIFNIFNELMFNIFMNNSDNYQSICILNNIYTIKLKNMDNKNIKNKLYLEILDNFMKLNRQLCSLILSNTSFQLQLIQILSLLFYNIFPYLDDIRKEDYVTLNDTIIIFMEGIKTICDNSIIKNILNAFSCLINSKQSELIKMKYNDIVKCGFYSLDHYNNIVINFFNNFCYTCVNYDKSLFLNVLKEILNSREFSCFNDKYKNVIFNYFDFYYNNINKLKNIVIDMMNISKKINVQEILEEYNQELRNKKKDYLKIKNVKNIIVNNVI